MPLKIVFLRPQNWSQLKPYYYSTITAVKGLAVLNRSSAILQRFRSLKLCFSMRNSGDSGLLAMLESRDSRFCF